MSVTLTPEGDVVVDMATLYKCRSEEIIISNADTSNKLIILVEGLRMLAPDGTMGSSPVIRYTHGFTLPELMGITIGGVTFLQVMTWIQTWAAGVNLEDAPKLADQLVPKSSTVVETPVDGCGSTP